jgi:hypothetical protein
MKAYGVVVWNVVLISNHHRRAFGDETVCNSPPDPSGPSGD